MENHRSDIFARFISCNMSILNKLGLYTSFLFIFFFISCKDNPTEPSDSEKPIVAIVYPSNGADVKADTAYTIIASATDNKGVINVEFYIDEQKVSSDSSLPYEYIWNTSSLSGNHTIVAKGYDAANNIGVSPKISVAINHAPVAPSILWPANTAIGIATRPTLRWICNDPDNNALTYDVYLGINGDSIQRVCNNLNTNYYSNNNLYDKTIYYWKIVAKDNKGATTTSPVWSFTTGNNTVINNMVRVEGGAFQMGGRQGIAEELPVHTVTISSFSMDAYEITYEKWTEVRNWALLNGYYEGYLPAGQNGNEYMPSGVNNPVVQVHWCNAINWCNARSEMDGLTPVYYEDSTQTTVCSGYAPPTLSSNAVKWDANGYRLPTEAEWEFAARGGIKSQGYTFSGSNFYEDVASYSSGLTTTGLTTMVGQKSANELGIYDMSGNVWEYCWDIYGAYTSDSQTDPKGATISSYLGTPQNNSWRALRGGGPTSQGFECYVGKRWLVDANNPNPNYEIYYGFRCVKK